MNRGLLHLWHPLNGGSCEWKLAPLLLAASGTKALSAKDGPRWRGPPSRRSSDGSLHLDLEEFV